MKQVNDAGNLSQPYWVNFLIDAMHESISRTELWGKSPGYRWISLTTFQWCGKRDHIMMSSCSSCILLTCKPRSLKQRPRALGIVLSWWRHQMETFSALLAICAGNSSVPGEFPAQRPVTRSFDVFFDLRLNKRLSKQSCGWGFETISRPLWRHRNVLLTAIECRHRDWHSMRYISRIYGSRVVKFCRG